MDNDTDDTWADQIDILGSLPSTDAPDDEATYRVRYELRAFLEQNGELVSRLGR